MIWITSQGKHLPISQMDNNHLENCINYLMTNHKPSCIIYNIKAKVWVKTMSKELNYREIAKLNDEIEDLRNQNLKLKKKFDLANAKLEGLKKDNETWDSFKF